MKATIAALSLFALLPSVLGESIIVFCSAGKDATEKAKNLVLVDGGRLLYEYKSLGGFAAVVTNLPTIASDPLFKLNECFYTLDEIVTIPKPPSPVLSSESP
ncbi:hypothetical protein V8F20_001880 [Naviculisporaceae sp. PSN 640]